MGQDSHIAEEALAQLAARLWFALQCERLYQRSNQWAREYQDILLSLDMKAHLRARAINLFNAGLAIAAGACMTAGALVAKGVIRGTGPLARLFFAPAARQAAVAAEASQAAAATRLIAMRHTQYRAAAAAGRMVLSPPQWVIRELQVMPGILLRQLWRERAMRITLGIFSSLPMIVANAGVGQITGSEGRPRGSVGTLKHLLNMGAGSDQEIKLSLERTEQIIAGLLSSLNADQKALLTMSEEELQNVMVHLDAEIFGKLRDDPQLRQEKADDEVRLFLRSQILMDYWLGVQNWVDLLRPRANSELRKFAQQFR